VYLRMYDLLRAGNYAEKIICPVYKNLETIAYFVLYTLGLSS